MSQITAEVVKRILRDIYAPDAVLLRGTASILHELPQNDIDLYIPARDWDSPKIFGKNQTIALKRSAPKQFKVTLREADSGAEAILDVFQQVTWRGLLMIDIETLPTQHVDELGVCCLNPEAEAWVTVLKNALHGSPTPAHKLEIIKGTPVFSILEAPPSKLRLRLQQQVEKSVWASAHQETPDLGNVWMVRISLVAIRLLEHPIDTLQRLTRWVSWRITQRFSN